MTSVAVVVLDTLRKDAFDRHFDWLPGRRYEQAYSTSHWTVPAHASLFTGRYPSTVDVHAKNLYFDADGPVLAEQLRRAGYTTRAYSANPNVSGHFDFDRGFDEFRSPAVQEQLTAEHVYDWRRMGREAEGVAGYARGLLECLRGDWETIPSVAAAVSLLRNGGYFGVDSAADALQYVRETGFGDREFLFVNLMEAHEPYQVPPEYRSVPTPDSVSTIGEHVLGGLDPAQTRSAYDDAVRYLSDAYRDVFDELMDAFDVVVTLSDHGEHLGEGGHWGHEYGVAPELTRVPLCVSGTVQAGVVDVPVSLRDVVPTVLELAGVDRGSDDHTLLDPDPERECHTEFHGLTPWSAERLEREGVDEATIDAYDRPVVGYAAPDYYGYEDADGLDESGAAPGSVDLAERLREIGAEFGGVEARRRAIPDDVMAQLEGLGYR